MGLLGPILAGGEYSEVVRTNGVEIAIDVAPECFVGMLDGMVERV